MNEQDDHKPLASQRSIHTTGMNIGVESRRSEILYYYILWCELQYTTRCSVWQAFGGRNVDMFLEGLLLLGKPPISLVFGLKSEGEVDGFTLLHLRRCDRKRDSLYLTHAVGIAHFLGF